jgi:hypothetical protein
MKRGDLALLDKEEIVLLLDILPAWGKVLWNGGAMWLELERLSPINWEGE